MSDTIRFTQRAEFRKWLSDNHATNGGVWLIFDKNVSSQTLAATDALEEALCFGWIDGQMRKIDDKTYKKYFAPRRAKSRWSEKNKALVAELEKRGLMTTSGRDKINAAQKDGSWDTPDLMKLTEDQVNVLINLLKSHEPAHANFLNMPPSVRKTYARAYYDAKTDAGREKRLAWIIERLDKNLRPK